MGTWTPGYSATLLPCRDVTWDVSPGSSSQAQQSRSCPVLLLAHGRAGTRALGTQPCAVTPRGWTISKCLHVQDMNQPGQERSSRSGTSGAARAARQRRCQIPGGLAGRAQAAAAPLSPPDQPRARQTPGLAFISLFARLCFPAAKPWHGGTGPGPCLTLTWCPGSSRACPAVPPCPQAQACSSGPARAFLPGEPVLDRLFKGTLVPFILPHV